MVQRLAGGCSVPPSRPRRASHPSRAEGSDRLHCRRRGRLGRSLVATAPQPATAVATTYGDRVRLLRLAQNQGASGAINEGIAAARRAGGVPRRR